MTRKSFLPFAGVHCRGEAAVQMLDGRLLMLVFEEPQSALQDESNADQWTPLLHIRLLYLDQEDLLVRGVDAPLELRLVRALVRLLLEEAGGLCWRTRGEGD